MSDLKVEVVDPQTCLEDHKFQDRLVKDRVMIRHGNGGIQGALDLSPGHNFSEPARILQKEYFDNNGYLVTYRRLFSLLMGNQPKDEVYHSAMATLVRFPKRIIKPNSLKRVESLGWGVIKDFHIKAREVGLIYLLSPEEWMDIDWVSLRMLGSNDQTSLETMGKFVNRFNLENGKRTNISIETRYHHGWIPESIRLVERV